MLEAPQLMFTMPDNHPLKNLAEPKPGLIALEEQLPNSMYSEPVIGKMVTVKLEPNAEEFPTLCKAGTDNSAEVSHQSQLWTSGLEKSIDATDPNVCVLLPEVRYPLSPATEAANEQQGYTSPIKDLSFLDHKRNDQMMISDQYSVMGMQSTSSHKLQDHHIPQEVAMNEFSAMSDGTHEGGMFHVSAPGNQQDNCGQQANGQNCYICSSCGQSFDSFNLFQRHQCKTITELPFGCKICGKTFNQMSVLKLHLKLHVE